MLLWVGGDGHCAGAYACNDFACCEDDFPLWPRGRQPHPDNAKINWATTVAKTLRTQFVNEADVNDTPELICKKGYRFVESNIARNRIVVLIGFRDLSSKHFQKFSGYLKRKETRHIFFKTEDYYQFNIQNGFKPNERNFFGADAHQAWANVMVAQLKRLGFV